MLIAVTAVSCVLGFAACGDESDKDATNKLATPANFTFDSETGTYSFEAVENGQFYYIVVVKYDNKGNEYTDIIGMTSMIPGTGTITGKVQFQAFSDATITPGAFIEVTELPKASYTAKCIATASGFVDSDPATADFTIGGTLEFPKTTYTVENGKLNVKLACYYLEQSLWFYGLPSRIEVYVKNKSTNESITTLTFDDFSFTNSFLAYKTYYLFPHAEQDYALSEGLTADDIVVTAKAFGNGSTIQDSIEVPSYNFEGWKRVVEFSDFGKPDAGWDDFWKDYM